MEIIVMARTYNLFGSNSTLSLIGDFLIEGAPNFGTAVNELEITLNFAHSPPAKKALENLFSSFHASLSRMPLSTFRRSRQKASLEYVSELFDGRELHKSRLLSFSLFERGVNEIVARLPILQSRFTRKDDFDFSGFINYCEARKLHVPENAADFEKLASHLDATRKARLNQQTPWDKVGLDWRDFHPDARAVLDDPFYWSGIDEFSPNGNDTGADVLALYREWLRSNDSVTAPEFLQYLFKKWGIPIPPNSLENMIVYDEAVVGLAFADLKLRGTCNARIASMAHGALQRQLQQAKNTPDWPHHEKRIAAIDQLRGKLPSGS